VAFQMNFSKSFFPFCSEFTYLLGKCAYN